MHSFVSKCQGFSSFQRWQLSARPPSYTMINTTMSVLTHTHKAWAESLSVSFRRGKKIKKCHFWADVGCEFFWVHICACREWYFLGKRQALSSRAACPHTECLMTHKKWLLSWSSCALCRNTIKTHFSHPERFSNRSAISCEVMYVIRFNVLAMFLPRLCPQDVRGMK